MSSYLTDADLRLYTQGLDVSGISQQEMGVILANAKDLIDSYANTTFDIQTIPPNPTIAPELQNWDDQEMTIFTDKYPLRTLTGLTILVSVTQGKPSLYTIDMTNPNMGQNSVGDSFIDPWTGEIQPTSILLKAGILPVILPALGIYPVKVQISYTYGYDNTVSGTIPAGIPAAGSQTVVLGTPIDLSQLNVGQSVMVGSGLTVETVAVTGLATQVQPASPAPGQQQYTVITSFTATFAQSHAANAPFTTLASDGLSMPYPTWLKTATRYTVIDELSDRAKVKAGLLPGIQSFGVQDFRMTRVREVARIEEAQLPLKARKIIDRHYSAHVR